MLSSPVIYKASHQNCVGVELKMYEQKTPPEILICREEKTERICVITKT